MRKADFYFLKIIAWTIVFMSCSAFMTSYEIIMSAGKPLSTTGYVTVPSEDQGSVNLFNEGAVGYGILSIICLSVLMWCREWLNLQKECRSLVYSESVGNERGVILGCLER